MTYCSETTQSHNLIKLQPSCREKICDIVRREGGSGIGYPDYIVLDLDSAEKTLAKKEKRSCNQTMDIAFGVAELRRNDQTQITKTINNCFVLVDFKLNTTRCRGAHKSDFSGKVDYSKKMFVGYSIYPKYYFIYPKRLKAQAKSLFARLFSNRPGSAYTVLTEDELLDLWFT